LQDMKAYLLSVYVHPNAVLFKSAFQFASYGGFNQFWRVNSADERLTKVDFTNLDKILYPKLQIKKAQVIEHYIRFAPRMLDLLKNRSIVLTRFPNGVREKGFYEKDTPEGTPSWVKTAAIYSETAKRIVNYIVVNDLDTLVWLGNLAALEIHMPFSRLDSREKPDFVFFDIDPEPPATFDQSIDVALSVKEDLDGLGLKSFVKTSGKKGLHIVIPIARGPSFSQTRAFAHRIGQHIAGETEMVVSEFSDTKKPGKVFIDYLQNSHGRTMICPHSLRAVEEATVSCPLEWTEVKKGLKPTQFNLLTMVKRKSDPWKNILEKPQELEVK